MCSFATRAKVRAPEAVDSELRCLERLCVLGVCAVSESLAMRYSYSYFSQTDRFRYHDEFGVGSVWVCVHYRPRPPTAHTAVTVSRSISHPVMLK